jgi:hypothetical protein
MLPRAHRPRPLLLEKALKESACGENAGALPGGDFFFGIVVL